MTDKADQSHSFKGLSYLDIYERYFEEYREKDSLALLEIGVKDSASLRTWKTYFQNAVICGTDIDPDCKAHEEDRIRIEIGSQDDKDFLRKCFGSDTKFDIIIDDGSHVNSFTIASFEGLFEERLKSGGLYIIEDLLCSYSKLQEKYNILDNWPGMRFNDRSKNFNNERADLDRFFQEKISMLDGGMGSVLTIHFWSQMCILQKA